MTNVVDALYAFELAGQRGVEALAALRTAAKCAVVDWPDEDDDDLDDEDDDEDDW